MFFQTNKCLIFLSSNSLIIANSKIQEKLQLNPEVIKNKTLNSEEKFDEAVIEFIGKLDLKKTKAFLMLSEDLIYEKEVSLDDKVKAEQEINKFLKEIQSDSNQIARIHFIKNKNFLILATNKNLYKKLIEVCSNVNIKISLVFPSVIFGEKITDENIDSDKIKTIFSKEKMLKRFDFLTKSDKDEKIPVENNVLRNNQDNKMKTSLIVLGIVAVALIVFSVMKIKDVSNLLFQNLQTRVTPTVIPTITPTPTVIPIAKDKIKIQILNGSGVAGQAKVIKTALEKLGYSNIQTSNADEERQGTVVKFVPGVTVEVKKEIIDELNKTFSSTISEEVKNQDTEVLIITGR